MNDTHRDEVELINQLGSLLGHAMQGNPDEAAITEKLDEWLMHTREHFSNENNLMQQHNFPAYPVHRAEHERVLGQIENLHKDWLHNKSATQVADYLFIEWADWFNQHVNSMDKVTAAFLSRQLPDL